jgi:hypothetical protein
MIMLLNGESVTISVECSSSIVTAQITTDVTATTPSTTKTATRYCHDHHFQQRQDKPLILYCDSHKIEFTPTLEEHSAAAHSLLITSLSSQFHELRRRARARSKSDSGVIKKVVVNVWIYIDNGVVRNSRTVRLALGPGEIQTESEGINPLITML